MTVEPVNNTEKQIKKTNTPLIIDFLHAINKIKKLDGVLGINIFPNNNNDCMNLYITVKEEKIELNDQIFSSIVHWQEDYSEFIETHILEENESHYIPQGAFIL